MSPMQIVQQVITFLNLLSSAYLTTWELGRCGRIGQQVAFSNHQHMRVT